jgi:hypothetical protein
MRTVSASKCAGYTCASTAACANAVRRWENSRCPASATVCAWRIGGHGVLQRAPASGMHVHVAAGHGGRPACVPICSRSQPRRIIGPADAVARQPQHAWKARAQPGRLGKLRISLPIQIRAPTTPAVPSGTHRNPHAATGTRPCRLAAAAVIKPHNADSPPASRPAAPLSVHLLDAFRCR